MGREARRNYSAAVAKENGHRKPDRTDVLGRSFVDRIWTREQLQQQLGLVPPAAKRPAAKPATP